MKKHLTESPPPLKSMGVVVPPEIEAVVRHALSKEPGERTASVEKFLEELRDAVNSASAALKTTGDSPGVFPDPHHTIASPPLGSVTGAVSVKGAQTSVSGFETKYDPASGAPPPVDERMRQASITNEALQREQDAKERFARESLARDEEERKRRLSAETERQRREREEREEKDRLHKEQLDRVARQAEELEAKLSRLATSMAPQGAAVIDPEATQVQQRTMPIQVIGEDSKAAVPGNTWQQTAGAMTGGFPDQKKSPVMMIGIALLVVMLGGVALGGYYIFRDKPVVVVNGNNGTQPPKNTNNNTNTDPPAVFKAEWVEIPGGRFKWAVVMDRPRSGPPIRSQSRRFTWKRLK